MCVCSLTYEEKSGNSLGRKVEGPVSRGRKGRIARDVANCKLVSMNQQPPPTWKKMS